MKPIDYIGEIWKFFHGIMEEAAPEMTELGLYPRVLFLLAKVGEYPYPAQLAEALLVPAPTVSFIVRHFEKQGVLSRQTDTADLRRCRLTLTDKGQTLLGRGQEIVNRYAGQRMLRLNKEQLAEFAALLKILTEADRRAAKGAEA